MTNELADPMMERDFESLDGDGNSGAVKFVIGKPYLKPNANTNHQWRCPIQIIGIGEGRIWQAPGGRDSIEAVHIGLLMAKSLLEHESSRYNTKITWQGDEELALYWLPPGEQLSDQDASEIREGFQKAFDDFFLQFGKGSKDKPS